MRSNGASSSRTACPICNVAGCFKMPRWRPDAQRFALRGAEWDVRASPQCAPEALPLESTMVKGIDW
jgi:hypothetical protein